RCLLLALPQLGFIEARLEHAHGGRAVLVLRAVILAGDDDAGGDVGDTHRRIGGVDVLPARAGGAVGVDLEVAFLDVDLDIVVDHRVDPHRREAGVPPRGAVVGRDTHEPMHAAFGLGIAIGVLALEQQRGGLDAGLLAGLIFDDLYLETALLGPALIHALEHLGPVLALGAARTGVDLDIGVVAIRLAGEQRRHLVAVGTVG